MAGQYDLSDAVAQAKMLLREFGHPCDVSWEEFERWFQTDTPYPDIGIDEVISNPLLVVHEIVEIDAVQKMGLRIEKDVIVSNLKEVDRAHLEAARIELDIAIATKNKPHIEDRPHDVKAWSRDPLVEPAMRAMYSQLYSSTERALETLTKSAKKRK